MANIKSQIKRNRQNEVRHERNKSVRAELKTRVRRVLEAVESGDESAARQALVVAQRRFDMAASKGIIAANTAARRKARLARRVNSLSA